MESHTTPGVRRIVKLLRSIPKPHLVKVTNVTSGTVEGSLEDVREDQNIFIVQLKDRRTHRSFPLDVVETAYASFDGTFWVIMMRLSCPPAYPA